MLPILTIGDKNKARYCTIERLEALAFLAVFINTTVTMSQLILFNKPCNVLCQFTDEKNRKTLADYIDIPNVYPAGRLDYDSEGLLILTDNGALQHQISHPVAKLSKTYWAQVEGLPSDSDLQLLRNGISLNDGPCRPAKVRCIAEPQCWPRTPPIRQRKNIPTQWLELTITQGRNRQVRRMTAAIGFPTLRLIRTRIGQWSVDTIAPGSYKILTVHTAQAKPPRAKYTPKSRRNV